MIRWFLVAKTIGSIPWVAGISISRRSPLCTISALRDNAINMQKYRHNNVPVDILRTDVRRGHPGFALVDTRDRRGHNLKLLKFIRSIPFSFGRCPKRGCPTVYVWLVAVGTLRECDTNLKIENSISHCLYHTVDAWRMVEDHDSGPDENSSYCGLQRTAGAHRNSVYSRPPPGRTAIE